MPTPGPVFAAVAAALSEIDPLDDAAVENFYRYRFVAYPEATRTLIADFVMASADMPAAEDLSCLKALVALDPGERPAVEAPPWDQAHGGAMAYEQAEQADYVAPVQRVSVARYLR